MKFDIDKLIGIKHLFDSGICFMSDRPPFEIHVDWIMSLNFYDDAITFGWGAYPRYYFNVCEDKEKAMELVYKFKKQIAMRPNPRDRYEYWECLDINRVFDPSIRNRLLSIRSPEIQESLDRYLSEYSPQATVGTKMKIVYRKGKVQIRKGRKKYGLVNNVF